MQKPKFMSGQEREYKLMDVAGVCVYWDRDLVGEEEGDSLAVREGGREGEGGEGGEGGEASYGVMQGDNAYNIHVGTEERP